MKKIYFLLFVALAVLNCQKAFAQNDTILIDFGAVSTSSPAPWNNLNDVMGAGSVSQLKNSDNLVTGMGINVFNRFNGINESGAATPDVTLSFPASATRDNYYGSVSLFSGQLEPEGAMQFSGLNPAKTYTFTIFASRAGATDNRDAKYKFVGFISDSVYLNASSNTSNTVSAAVQPKADGTIDLWVSPGENNNNPTYKFYYIGALKMVYEHEDALPSELTLTSLNGGGELNAGSTQTISWTSFNLIEDVIISYSTDNGANWTTVDTVANTQLLFDWILPATFSSQCLVKLTSGAVSDVSETAFTIVNPFDTILIDFGLAATSSPSPWNNLTDVMGAGSIAQLVNSNNLVTGMGINVFNRFNGINTTGTSTPDAMLGLPVSATTDNYYGSIAPFSGATEPEGAMQITGLNPAKTYTFTIFASRAGVADNREAKYKFVGFTTDSVYLNASNNTATTVSASMQPKADGTIDLWVSPGENNNNPTYKFYYIGTLKMVYEHEAALPAVVALTSPNGGEVWNAGSTQTISWTATNPTEDFVVSYSTDNGINWIPIDTVGSMVNSIEWILPAAASNQCLVRITSGASNDVSESTFAIQDPYDRIFIDFGRAVTASPDPWNNLSDDMGAGEITHLKNSNNMVTGMGIYVFDRFNGINETGALTTDPLLGLPSSATRDNYYGSIAPFSGATEPEGAMRITGLNPAKTYAFTIFASRAGVTDNREAKYKFVGFITDSIYLNASNNTTTTVSTSMQPKADGTIDLWVSPGENNNNPTYKFYYIGTLTIVYEHESPLAPAITVTAPNGGEEWLAGSTQSISWTGLNLAEDVVVSYSIDNGTSWIAIDTVANTVQSLDWNLPATASNQCLVNVTSGTASDVSENTFTIKDATIPSITLTSPGTGEYWIIGSTQNIRWSSISLTSNIEIQYSTDNGNNWLNVATVASPSTSYKWTIPDSPSTECLIKLNSGVYADTSNTTFTIREAQCSKTIVVLGSSTAAGTGPSVADSAWVRRYTADLKKIDPAFTVVNLAVGGYVTYKILPTGTPMPSGVNETIDVAKNVTKALTYSPYAIIVNMPSNDAVKYYSVEKQMANYEIIRKYANERGINVWFTTTQPRNFTDPVQIKIQKDMAVAVMETYGDYAIDFWTRTAAANGFILSQYNVDGVHLNNAGHRILFEELLKKRIDTLACISTSIKDERSNINGVRAYPNPFSDHSVIEFKSTSGAKAEVRFVDVTGRQVGYLEKSVTSAGTHNITVSKDQIKSKNSIIFALITVKDQTGTKQSKVKLIRVDNN